jgi:phenylalanyl-tRNA synthetase beta chain
MDKCGYRKSRYVQKHPQADKLSLCSVSDGASSYSVVCGAPNVAAGQTVAFARIGAVLPGDFTIKRAKIRGVESEGMLCSLEELGMATESNGIHVLPETTPLGRPLEEVLGDNDAILEVEISTNRPDCLSHWGVAREIAARLNKPVRLPEIKKVEVSNSVTITNNEPELCTRYIGTVIEGVKVGPSPEWMVRKLEKCGLRSINNIVDVTNYVLMELGQPLHAFDRACLKDQQIVVRRAVPQEKILALDGKEYTLTDTMLVIADTEKPQAIAGVIGGKNSSVSEATTSIIVESALFKPTSIRRTSRAIGVTTDSSYRFERGTAWETAELAAWRAITLIQQLAGGTVTARTDLKQVEWVPAEIALRPERVEHVLDLEFTREEIHTILRALGISTKDEGSVIKATIPSWRLDIKQEIDLIEELARIKGYDKVPVTVMPIVPDMEQGKAYESAEQVLRKRIAAVGFSEAMNQSFAEEKNLEQFKLPVVHRIKNPLSKENEVLRTSMITGLWKNFVLNKSVGYDDLFLFETGTVFTRKGEKKVLSLIASGSVLPQWWGWGSKEAEKKFDFYFLNGLILNILAGNHVRIKENKEPSPFYHPGKTAVVEMNGKTVGEFGILRPEYSQEYNGVEIAYAELDLRLIDQCWNRKVPQYETLRRLPPVKRDLSIVADKDVRFDNILSTLQKAVSNDTLATEITLTDVYQDEVKLPGKKSYTLHFTFRPGEKTMTDAEVNTLTTKILDQLKSAGITLR